MGPDDLDDLATLLADPVVMAHYPRPRTREEAAAWIDWNRANYARDGFGLWLLRDVATGPEGSFVGDCGLTWQLVDDVEELELGYHSSRRARARAWPPTRACRDLAVRRGVTRLIAIIRPDNTASRRVAENVGLTLDRTTVDRSGQPVVVYAADY